MCSRHFTSTASIVARMVTFVALLGLAIGCGSSEAVSSFSPGELGARIRQLETGDSVATVEAKLGPPDRENEAEGETVLYYGHWQLAFSPQLRSRTKYLRGEHWQNRQALKHVIGRLNIGEGEAQVRKLLGTPFAFQILKSQSPEEVTLWYGEGRWALRFVNQTLARIGQF